MLVPAPVVIETAWLIARDLGNVAEASFVAAAGRVPALLFTVTWPGRWR